MPAICNPLLAAVLQSTCVKQVANLVIKTCRKLEVNNLMCVLEINTKTVLLGLKKTKRRPRLVIFKNDTGLFRLHIFERLIKLQKKFLRYKMIPESVA